MGNIKHAINDYIQFYSTKRPQDRYHCKTPLEVRNEALQSEIIQQYLIPTNKRIEKYKEKWSEDERPHKSVLSFIFTLL